MNKLHPDCAVRDAISDLKNVSDLQGLHHICSQVCGLIDIPYFSYTAQIPISMVSPEYVFINNYPEALWKKYKRDNLLSSDPIFRYCTQNLIPVLWSNTDSYIHSHEDIRFMRRLIQHDLFDGISFPLRSHKGGVAVISFVSSSTDEDISDYLEDLTSELMLLGTHVHNTVNRLSPYGDSDTLRAKISQREKECLLWTSEGKTTGEIGKILGISVSTVTYHIQNVARKLNVSNRQQAVARGIALGIVSPQTQPEYIRCKTLHE